MNFLKWISNHWLSILISFLFVTTFIWVCGLGLSAHNVATAIFNSLQFLVLNKDIDTEELVANVAYHSWILWGLIFMQFMLPTLASIGLIRNLFREQLEPFVAKISLYFKKDYVVIIGCGAVGFSIAKAFYKDGIQVLIIDNNQDNSHHKIVKALIGDKSKCKPVIWMRGNILDDEVLYSAKLNKAQKIFICTGDDNLNLEIFGKMCAISALNIKSDIRVELSSVSARHALKDCNGWASLQGGSSSVNVSGFDIYDLAAREAFNKHSPDRYAETNRNADISQIMMVIGSSRMGAAMVQRAGRLGHYSVKGKLLVIWVDQDVESAAKELFRNNPNLNPSVISKDLNTPIEHSSEILPSILIETIPEDVMSSLRHGRLAELIKSRVPASIFVCHEDEAKNADEARQICAFFNRFQLEKSIKDKIMVVAIQSEGQYRLSVEHTKRHDLNVHAEEMSVLDAVSVALLKDENKDRLAMYFNTVVYSKRDWKNRDHDWKKLSEIFKESNRDVADHLAFKLRYALGIEKSDEIDEIIKGSIDNGINQSQLEPYTKDLSFVEHNRYCAFMFSSGFYYSGVLSQMEKEKQRTVRVNPTLIPFSLLKDNEVQKDKDMVEQIVSALHCGKAM